MLDGQKQQEAHDTNDSAEAENNAGENLQPKGKNPQPKGEHKRWENLYNWIKALKEKSEGTQQKTTVKWLDIFTISIACYAPAFLLVFLSSLFFKPASSSQQESKTSSGNPSLTTQQKEQIREEVKDFLRREKNNTKIQQNFPFADKYIDGQIKLEAQEQAERAAKDEIDQLKADWKGDLFGQISFPVIFAIASIFAAFAVKDILTEILKEQDKEKLKQELSQNLNENFSRELSKLEDFKNDLEKTITSRVLENIGNRIRHNEAYIACIDYEISSLRTEQCFSNLKEKFSSPDVADIRRSIRRSISALSLLAYEHSAYKEQSDLLIRREVILFNKQIKDMSNHENLESLLDPMKDFSNSENRSVEGNVDSLVKEFSHVRLNNQLIQIIENLLETTTNECQKEKLKMLITRIREINNLLGERQDLNTMFHGPTGVYEQLEQFEDEVGGF